METSTISGTNLLTACSVARSGRYSVVPGRHVAFLLMLLLGALLAGSFFLSLDNSAAGRPRIARFRSHVVGVIRSRPWPSQRIFRNRSATGVDDE